MKVGIMFSKKFFFYAIMYSVTIIFLVCIWTFLWPHLDTALRPHIVEYISLNMPEEERQRIYDEIAATSGSLWDVAPEPLVGRLAKRNLTIIHKKAEVETNNAGMRSSKEYTEKMPGVFRIVFLGDSFIFGTAGKEEDRLSDQLEEYYRNNKIFVDNKNIEVLALGLGSWTAVQESTYLSSRISSYDPDVIIVLTVGNDITDSSGVTGSGTASSLFSPEHREWGSAVFTSTAGLQFGFNEFTALNTNLSPEARNRWEKAMRSMENLVKLQHRRKKTILLSVLSHGTRSDNFVELYKYYVQKFQAKAPHLVTSYFESPETRLPHDRHPNRYGFSILRNHYIHALHELGWVKVSGATLPELDKRLSLDFNPELQIHKINMMKDWYMNEILKSSLDFRHLTELDLYAFLGGIFPEKRGKVGLGTPPWGSIRSAFLLKIKDLTTKQIDIEIMVPPLVELFPFEISMHINGVLAETFNFSKPNDSVPTVHLNARLPADSIGDGVIEVLLETDRYFTTIQDARMKSYQLISAQMK